MLLAILVGGWVAYRLASNKRIVVAFVFGYIAMQGAFFCFFVLVSFFYSNFLGGDVLISR